MNLTLSILAFLMGLIMWLSGVIGDFVGKPPLESLVLTGLGVILICESRLIWRDK